MWEKPTFSICPKFVGVFFQMGVSLQKTLWERIPYTHLKACEFELCNILELSYQICTMQCAKAPFLCSCLKTIMTRFCSTDLSVLIGQCQLWLDSSVVITGYQCRLSVGHALTFASPEHPKLLGLVFYTKLFYAQVLQDFSESLNTLKKLLWPVKYCWYLNNIMHYI